MQHISDSCTPESKTALVIKALLSQDQRSADPLAEVIALADTAGVEVLDSLVQKLHRPNPATWIGEGKVAEAGELANELDVDFIIADNDLSPAQEHNIEKITEKTVIDRSQLIMDIFPGVPRPTRPSCRSSWRSCATACHGSSGCGLISHATKEESACAVREKNSSRPTSG